MTEPDLARIAKVNSDVFKMIEETLTNRRLGPNAVQALVLFASGAVFALSVVASAYLMAH